MIKDTAMGFGSPGKYIQERGALNRLVQFTSKFGSKVFVLADGFIYDRYAEALAKQYGDGENNLTIDRFSGEVTANEIARVTQLAQGATVMVGVGGGKTMDTAKAVAHRMRCGLVIVPTTASTDAPSSALAVVYQENGEHSHVEWFSKNPDLVLVDTEVIAKAPVRFLVSGMGDALSTYLEARANAESNTANYVNFSDAGGMKRTLTSMMIAKGSYDILMQDGRKAKASAELQVHSQALENIIEVNILMSGLGFENTGCAGAHSIADGITVLPAGGKTLHGEKVAFGCICQLVAENRSEEELEEVLAFCFDLGLPITLEDLSVQNTLEHVRAIAEGSMKSFWASEPFPVTADMVVDYILLADKLGTQYKMRRNQTGRN